MKNFLQYFISYTNNWLWTLCSLLFIGLLINSAHKYQSVIFYLWASIPFILMVYNFIDEYNAYLFKRDGARKVSAKQLAHIAYGSCFLVLLTIVAMIVW